VVVSATIQLGGAPNDRAEGHVREALTGGCACGVTGDGLLNDELPPTTGVAETSFGR